jgi:hypothetical protein
MDSKARFVSLSLIDLFLGIELQMESLRISQLCRKIAAANDLQKPQNQNLPQTPKGIQASTCAVSITRILVAIFG